MHRALLVACLLLGLTAPPAAAADLAGRTEIRGDRPGLAIARLAQAVPADRVRLSHDGPSGALAGVVLRAEAPDAQGRHATLSSAGATSTRLLPAGDYRVVLVTGDGVPRTGRVEIAGLGGATTLTLAARLPVRSLLTQSFGSTGRTAIAGHTVRSVHTGLGRTRLVVALPATSGGTLQRCRYAPGADRVPGAYGPGCPGGSAEQPVSLAPGARFEPPGDLWTDAHAQGANLTLAGTGEPTLLVRSEWVDPADEPRDLDDDSLLAEPGALDGEPPSRDEPRAGAERTARPDAPAARCPRGVLRPGRHAGRRAAAAARRSTGTRVVRTRRGAPASVARSCGRATAARTYAVRLRDGRTALTARFRRGWRVWRVLPQRG